MQLNSIDIPNVAYKSLSQLASWRSIEVSDRTNTNKRHINALHTNKIRQSTWQTTEFVELLHYARHVQVSSPKTSRRRNARCVEAIPRGIGDSWCRHRRRTGTKTRGTRSGSDRTGGSSIQTESPRLYTRRAGGNPTTQAARPISAQNVLFPGRQYNKTQSRRNKTARMIELWIAVCQGRSRWPSVDGCAAQCDAIWGPAEGSLAFGMTAQIWRPNGNWPMRCARNGPVLKTNSEFLCRA